MLTPSSSFHRYLARAGWMFVGMCLLIGLMALDCILCGSKATPEQTQIQSEQRIDPQLQKEIDALEQLHEETLEKLMEELR